MGRIPPWTLVPGGAATVLRVRLSYCKWNLPVLSSGWSPGAVRPGCTQGRIWTGPELAGGPHLPVGLTPLSRCWSCSPERSPTWLNPVDTRCSWVPVHASRPSLLFSWACVLCRRQETELSHPRATRLRAPKGRRGQVRAPGGMAGAGGGLMSPQDGPQLRAVLYPEGRPSHPA